MTNREEILKDTDTIEKLTFQQVESRYTRVIIINTAIAYLLIMIVSSVLMLLDNFNENIIIFISSVATIAIIGIINIAIAGKACRFKGYALREKDITFRKGLFFHSIITIPFCKVQQVSISQNPIARLFGLYSINISNASAWQSSISIPGLTRTRAEQIKDFVTNKLNDAAK